MEIKREMEISSIEEMCELMCGDPEAEEMQYDGCRNCKYQIAPLRRCEWAENGGDGKIHLICPMWEKEDPDEHNTID